MNNKLSFCLTASLLPGVLLHAVVAHNGLAVREVAAQVSVARERTIFKKSDFKPPVKIFAVRTKKGALDFDKPFPDDDDWLKDLTVSLANASGKDLIYVDVEVLFRRPHNQKTELPGVWHLEFGNSPFRTKAAEHKPIRVKPILPGETLDVRLSEHDYDQLMIFLKGANYPLTIHGIEVRVNSIGFSDGTAWSGRMIRRDPDSPGGWSPIEPPGSQQPEARWRNGGARNRTAAFLPISLGDLDRRLTFVTRNREELINTATNSNIGRRFMGIEGQASGAGPGMYFLPGSVDRAFNLSTTSSCSERFAATIAEARRTFFLKGATGRTGSPYSKVGPAG